MLLGATITFLSSNGSTAQGIQAALGVLLVCSNGFLSRNIPVFLKWIQQASYLSFSEQGRGVHALSCVGQRWRG